MRAEETKVIFLKSNFTEHEDEAIENFLGTIRFDCANQITWDDKDRKLRDERLKKIDHLHEKYLYREKYTSKELEWLYRELYHYFSGGVLTLLLSLSNEESSMPVKITDQYVIKRIRHYGFIRDVILKLDFDWKRYSHVNNTLSLADIKKIWNKHCEGTASTVVIEDMDYYNPTAFDRLEELRSMVSIEDIP